MVPQPRHQAIPHPACRTLALGRWTIAIALATLTAAGLIAYGFADHFSLTAQVAAHLLIPVAAGFLKLGYVVRLAAHHSLGNFAAG